MKYSIFGFITCLLITACTSVNPSSKSALRKITNKGDKWEKIEKDQLTFYFIENSEVARTITTSMQKTERGVHRAMEFLGEAYDKPITIITVDDRQTMKRLINRETAGTALPASNTVIELSGVSATCHEKFHLVSINTWGMPKYWISEGTAVACDDEWWGYDLHQLANHLFQHDKIISLEKLVKRNSGFKKADSIISYPQVGSVVKYIDENYGRESLLKLWRSNDFQNSLGKSLSAFELEWIAEIKKHTNKDINYLEKINKQ